jgi:hypothetical protein
MSGTTTPIGYTGAITTYTERPSAGAAAAAAAFPREAPTAGALGGGALAVLNRVGPGVTLQSLIADGALKTS